MTFKSGGGKLLQYFAVAKYCNNLGLAKSGDPYYVRHLMTYIYDGGNKNPRLLRVGGFIKKGDGGRSERDAEFFGHDALEFGYRIGGAQELAAGDEVRRSVFQRFGMGDNVFLVMCLCTGRTRSGDDECPAGENRVKRTHFLSRTDKAVTAAVFAGDGCQMLYRTGAFVSIDRFAVVVAQRGERRDGQHLGGRAHECLHSSADHFAIPACMHGDRPWWVLPITHAGVVYGFRNVVAFEVDHDLAVDADIADDVRAILVVQQVVDLEDRA